MNPILIAITIYNLFIYLGQIDNYNLLYRRRDMSVAVIAGTLKLSYGIFKFSSKVLARFNIQL